jgi:hypothetical protein
MTKYPTWIYKIVDSHTQGFCCAYTFRGSLLIFAIPNGRQDIWVRNNIILQHPVALHRSDFVFCFYAVYAQRRLLFTRRFPLLTLWNNFRVSGRFLSHNNMCTWRWPVRSKHVVSIKKNDGWIVTDVAHRRHKSKTQKSGIWVRSNMKGLGIERRDEIYKRSWDTGTNAVSLSCLSGLANRGLSYEYISSMEKLVKTKRYLSACVSVSKYELKCLISMLILYV